MCGERNARVDETELGEIISRHGRRGLAAAMKVLWEQLEQSVVDAEVKDECTEFAEEETISSIVAN